MKRLTCMIMFFVALFILSSKDIYANFTENFEGDILNAEIWESYSNSGNIFVSDGKLHLVGSDWARSSPYLKSAAEIFPASGGYKVEISYQYFSAGFGNGMIFSYGDPPANGQLHTPPVTYMFGVWQGNIEGLQIYTWLCNNNTDYCGTPRLIRQFGIHDFSSHKFSIVFREDGTYKLYSDDEPEPFFVSGLTSRKLKSVWMGNSETTNTWGLWSSFDVDYIKITHEDETVPEIQPQVILVPGLGTSWDIPAILSGQSGNNWEIPPFVTVYDSLLKSFENAGFVKGDDLFIFPYDWRKPLSELSQNLSAFIIGHSDPGQKVDLIGHSMGGLVSRIFAQEYGTDKIDRIITAGSPHLGILDAYGVWEGASVFGETWWEKALVELATEINRQPGETKVDSIRRQAPSMKDLMPVYDFLSFEGVLKPWDQLSQNNAYLAEKNASASLMDSFLTAVIGTGKQTRSIINAKLRSKDDEADGLWEDGKPVKGDPFQYGDGDGTVLRDSATGPFSNNQSFSSYHVSLLSEREGIDKVFDLLELDKTNVEILPTDDSYLLRKVFLVVLSSPGRLEVCNLANICDEDLGIYYPEDKLFMLPGYGGENLRVRVVADGETGPYTLHFGDIDDEAGWYETVGNLQSPDQTDSYDVIDGGIRPTIKEQCYKNQWKQYGVFKNQGECVSYLQSNPKALANKKK